MQATSAPVVNSLYTVVARGTHTFCEATKLHAHSIHVGRILMYEHGIHVQGWIQGGGRGGGAPLTQKINLKMELNC